MRKAIFLSLASLLVAGAGLGAGVAVAWKHLNAAMSLPEPGRMLEIEPGTPLAVVTRRLNADGALPWPRLVDWYGRLRGDATRIQAGEYLLPAGLTPIGLLDKLSRGDVYLHSLTVIEGWRFDEFLAALRAHPAIAAGESTPAEIMAALGRPGTHPEGQFLPDTYAFPRGTNELDVLRQAHEALRKSLDDAWTARDHEVELESPYQALILASIIEKETALASERARISGVFHARLERGMRLQTDPTVIYGLGTEFDGNLTRRDLARDTAYNTYTRHGLPPTPISLPGAASISAAVNPEISGALYFVATGLGDGSHRFSETLDEHNRAVRDYLDRLRDQSD